MKATLLNKIRLWWHCLINMHRELSAGKFNGWLYIKEDISCLECDYGKTKGEE